MSVTLTGVLVDPLNNPLEASTRFVGGNKSLPYYNPATDFNTDSNGNYSIPIAYGVYDIYLATSREFNLIARSVVIDESTTATNLQELLQ